MRTAVDIHPIHHGIWLRVAAVLAALCLLLAARSAGDEGRTVYYQVTFDDGSEKDLPAVPDTNKGIRRVLRITRVDQGDKGFELLSTGPQPVTLVSRGQTYRTDLQWNGRAWVAPEEQRPTVAVAAGPATRPATPAEDAGKAGATTSAATLRLKAAMVDLAVRLLESEVRLAAEEKALGAQTASAPAVRASGAAVASQTVAEARKELRATAALLLAEAGGLASVSPSPRGGQAAPPGVPTPPSPAASGVPAGTVGEVGAPIANVATLPYRVQVWALPPGRGQRTYRVSMAHPEAGAAGAFYYVAYADTDGDGRPDKLIARSALAQSDRPGQWTQWDFATDARNVFVGSAWARGDTVHYHTETVRVEDQWQGLSGDVYISGDVWGMPATRRSHCYGNIRVSPGRR